MCGPANSASLHSGPTYVVSIVRVLVQVRMGWNSNRIRAARATRPEDEAAKVVGR